MRKFYSENENWQFTKQVKNGKPKFFARWESVTLPHTWNNLDGQDGGMDYYRGLCFYKKRLYINAGKSERVYIEIPAANSCCTVYANGKFAGSHRGGYSLFRFDITKFIRNGKCDLLIGVDNSQSDCEYPQTADFTFFGGLYRGVNVIIAPESHFELDYFGSSGLKITPKLNDDGTADVELCSYISNADGCSVEYVLLGNKIQADTAFCASYHIENPHLWNGVKDPYLYSIEARLIKNGQVIDCISEKFGVRAFKTDSRYGFMLNGKPYPLRGVSRHQDRENMGWAITDKEHKEDMELILETGANSVRLAHYQHAQEFYRLCDEKGLIVWAEIPFITSQLLGKAAKENTISQMKELIIQNYNHPSIMFWGISNEITIGGEVTQALLDNLNELNALCHNLDSGRYTTMAQLSAVEPESVVNNITDTLAYNHYFGWYTGCVEDTEKWIQDFHSRYPDRLLGLSEYGAEGILKYHSESPAVQDYTEEYQSYYHEQMLKIIENNPYLWCTYVWNMFDFASDMRDEGGVKGRNNKGLVTYDRKIKKDAFYIYKAYWSDEPFVHICSKRFKKRSNRNITVRVYSNQPSVSLYVNGEKVETLNGDKIFEFPITLDRAENSVKAVAENTEDTAVFVFTNDDCSEYVFNNELKGVNAKNWFEGVDNTGEMQFPEGYYSVHDTLGEVMKNPQAKAMIDEIIVKVENEFNIKITKSMMLMAKSFTIEKIISLAGNRIPKGTDIQANNLLNQIKK